MNRTLKERIQATAWSANVVSLPYTKSASNAAHILKAKEGCDLVTCKRGEELLVIYLNNFNKGG